jgi:hypothetical protein
MGAVQPAIQKFGSFDVNETKQLLTLQNSHHAPIRPFGDGLNKEEVGRLSTLIDDSEHAEKRKRLVAAVRDNFDLIAALAAENTRISNRDISVLAGLAGDPDAVEEADIAALQAGVAPQAPVRAAKFVADGDPTVKAFGEFSVHESKIFLGIEGGVVGKTPSKTMSREALAEWVTDVRDKDITVRPRGLDFFWIPHPTEQGSPEVSEKGHNLIETILGNFTAVSTLSGDRNAINNQDLVLLAGLTGKADVIEESDVIELQRRGPQGQPPLVANAAADPQQAPAPVLDENAVFQLMLNLLTGTLQP